MVKVIPWAMSDLFGNSLEANVKYYSPSTAGQQASIYPLSDGSNIVNLGCCDTPKFYELFLDCVYTGGCGK